MVGNQDFKYLLSKAQELMVIYYPQLIRSSEMSMMGSLKGEDFFGKVMGEITKQLFSNELSVIAGLSGHYNERVTEIQKSGGLP